MRNAGGSSMIFCRITAALQRICQVILLCKIFCLVAASYYLKFSTFFAALILFSLPPINLVHIPAFLCSSPASSAHTRVKSTIPNAVHLLKMVCSKYLTIRFARTADFAKDKGSPLWTCVLVKHNVRNLRVEAQKSILKCEKPQS